jgi:NitT/TauT family transport system permease protein
LSEHLTERSVAPLTPLRIAGARRELLHDRRLIYPLVMLASVIVWQVVSDLTMPIIVPPPAEVARAFWKSLLDGRLVESVAISYFRILAGWSIGCALAVPLGLLAGRNRMVRMMLEPYVEFFRFIPPIAFITLFMIWFGLGETAKIMLIVYTTLFVTFLNTMAGAMAVDREKIRAAQCMGASDAQIFRHVVVPATVPHIITGVRLAMGNAFMTVIAAEFIAAEAGIGHMIFASRLFAQTEFVFLGIIVLGVMGFFANWVLRAVVQRIAYRYSVQI